MNRPSDNLLPRPSDDDRPAGGLLTQLRISVVATIVLVVICCGLYPAIVWGLSQALFRHQANGSLIDKDGKPTNDDSHAVGSALLGQSFSDPKYFHPRPSAAGNGYDATASGGSNLGPTSAKLMFGTTKSFAYTVFAADKAPAAEVPVPGRVQGTVVEVTKTAITLTPAGAPAGTKTQFPLGAAVADPATAVNYHSRTVHATTIPAGAIVELKLDDKSPASVTAINVADQELDAGVASVDTSGNKITLNDSAGTVLNVDPKGGTVFVVNGKADAKLDAGLVGMAVHAVVATQMEFDGVADRVIHYCQDNKIDYKSSVPDSAFMDADGIDDVKLITAFNAAASPTSSPTIEPDAGKRSPDGEKALPADAVTASASGLDPHISPRNALLQAQRVADARNKPVDFVTGLIEQFTEPPQLGVFGDPRVNVLRLNLELDRVAPAARTTVPTTVPATEPAAPSAAPATTPATAAP